MPLLTCKNLCLGYDGKEIVHNLSFSINRGDYLCIVGENGSGKTTLMKTLLGLCAPLSGEFSISGANIGSKIGYLPQQTEAQSDFPASVWEIVLSGFQGKCGLRPFYSREERKIAAENIEKMGLTAHSRKCFRELSGGQKQRVLLARALCAAKEMLLLDEPVTGLDPNAAAEMYALVKQLNCEGMTVLMITHDVSSAVQNASCILHIGSELFFGTAAEYAQSGLYGNGGRKQ